MLGPMPSEFANVLVFVVLAAAFLGVTLLLGRFLRPSAPNAVKSAIYECGEGTLGDSWFNFNPRFYLIALTFLIFDVEVAFTYPVAVVFRRWVARGAAGQAFVEIGLFVVVLALGLAYVWRRGDLEWLRGAWRDDGAATAGDVVAGASGEGSEEIGGAARAPAAASDAAAATSAVS
jgi:NADH-quinone oxidoreductase subunit A